MVKVLPHLLCYVIVLFDVSAVVVKRLVVRQGVARYSKSVGTYGRSAVNEPVYCGSSR